MSTKRAVPLNQRKETGFGTFKDNKFPIVGIGASAGGLEALEQFFGNMQELSGMAFVVIQHLDPTHPGIMPELLQRITKMRVFQATERLKVMPNCVYVIPPNKSLSLLNGSLYLFDPVETRGLRLPVDYFFRSLAEDQHEKSIGIILSGMGSDGSLGLKAIKESYGIVAVQEPASAKFDGMPRSAIESVTPDIVAPANELPKRLLEYIKYMVPGKPGTEVEDKNKSNLEKIIILLRDHSGHDFSLYKKNTLFRRIERRKGIHQIEKISNYVRFLQANPNEVEILYKELLIGVTNFFRDPAVWDKLKDKIIPDLLNRLPERYSLRAWVPGCSTGEEAYSLAIIFNEIVEKVAKKKHLTLQIFATDLDSDGIEKARKGIYSSNIAADVSEERLNRFFTMENDGYRVNTAIREMIVFAPQDVIKDPPFTKLDILSCRNMLIYMEPALQKKLITLFNYTLKKGGIMMLGTAETLGTHRQGFTELDSQMKVYERSEPTLQNELVDFPSAFYHNKNLLIEKKMLPKVVDNIQVLADQVLLQRFAPASVLVNENGDIIYITGRTGKYLEPAAGKANMNIYTMAREGLRNELLLALRKAMNTFSPVIIHNLNVKYDGGFLNVDITVQRLETPDLLKGMIIVLFHDLPDTVEHEIVERKTRKRGSLVRQEQLENELQRSYEDLQSLREEMQTSQEELKSTNEELQSTNEELQSTNEELTTSKEEMQSLNEELQTVNIELQSKVSDFKRANDDLTNLLNSTEIATLFLDKNLNIRRFTEPITRIFKLRNTDIGRPFTDLVSDLQYTEIGDHSMQVIKTLISTETAIRTNDGRWFNIRIMPYRTLDDRIDGLVITFSDISESKKLESELKKSRDNFIILAENSQAMMFRIDSKSGIYEYISPVCEKITGYIQEDFYKNPYMLKNIIHPDFVNTFDMDWERRKNGDLNDAYEYKIITRNKEEKWIMARNSRVRDTAGNIIAYVGSVIDITAYKVNHEIQR
jgi:two-component system, chemotaxis family, CheB/CheR fusion protein